MAAKLKPKVAAAALDSMAGLEPVAVLMLLVLLAPLVAVELPNPEPEVPLPELVVPLAAAGSIVAL